MTGIRQPPKPLLFRTWDANPLFEDQHVVFILTVVIQFIDALAQQQKTQPADRFSVQGKGNVHLLCL